MANHALAEQVLKTVNQHPGLLFSDDMLDGADRLEANAPLKRGVRLNVSGVIAHLSGYAIKRTNPGADEMEYAQFAASKGADSGTVWDVSARLLGLTRSDTDELFGYIGPRHAIAALEQLAAGADRVDWQAVYQP